MNNSKLVSNADFKATVKKAHLIYTDYTMTSNHGEKDALLELLSMYIYKLNNLKMEIIYHSVCQCDESEKESYIEILGDILEEMLKDTEEV